MKCDLSLSEVAPQNPKLLSLICMHRCTTSSVSRLPFPVSLAMKTVDAEQREFYSL